MNRIVLLCMGTALLGATSGCSTITESDIDMYARSIALETNSRGEAVDVADRSGGEQTMTLTMTEENGRVTEGAVNVNGRMAGGSTVPGDSGMSVHPGSEVDWIPSFSNNDSFLTELDEGRDYALARYETQLGNRRVVTYGATQGNETSPRNMPTTGQATYNGSVFGTVYGSQTGEADLTGNVSMAANFGPGLRSMSGKMTRLRLTTPEGDKFRLGSDIVMERATISGNEYRNGKMHFVDEGTNTRVGTMVDSRYDGTFYGRGARETAGTFQFSARRVPIFGGGRESMQGVGVFGGAD